MNLYGFAGGDPVNSSDPFGLSAAGCHNISVSITESDNTQSSFQQRVCQKGSDDEDQGSKVDQGLEDMVAASGRSFTSPNGTIYLQPEEQLPALEFEHELTHAVQTHIIGAAQFYAREIGEQIYWGVSQIPGLGSVSPYKSQFTLEGTAEQAKKTCANGVCSFAFGQVKNVIRTIPRSGTFTWR